MGISYIPVVEEHKCETPYSYQCFQTGDGAPPKDKQLEAGIFYECDDCGVVWRLKESFTEWGAHDEYYWDLLLGWGIMPSWRKYKKAKKRGILADRANDKIVKELTNAHSRTSDESEW